MVFSKLLCLLAVKDLFFFLPMWRSLVNLFLLTIGLFSIVTFHASLRSSPLLLRATWWKAIKKSSEIIRSLAVGFFFCLCFCFLLSLTFCCHTLCSFVLFSQSGWASLVLPFGSAPQPLPPALSLLAAKWHSGTPRVKSWAHWAWWQNSHRLQRGQGFTLELWSVRCFWAPALVWALLSSRHSGCISSQSRRNGVTGPLAWERSFLALRCCISFASEGVLWQICPRAWVISALRLSKVCVPFYIFSLLLIWLLIALSQIT